MCNIAGYIGKKQAAPILAEMMKRQEGFFGGYYTGITTHDGEKLSSAKVIGTTQTLIEEKDILSLKGTTGFMHSRSKSGGKVEWAHPFTSNDGQISYVANGWRGKMLTADMNEARKVVAADLWKNGYQFTSKVEGTIGDYLQPEENVSIHDSEFMCQYIVSLVDKGMTVDAAMSKAMSDFPTEIVALVMNAKNPETIFASRMNFPMMVGIAEDGDTYLASTVFAFPEDVKFRVIEFLPAKSTYEVFKGGYKMSTETITIDDIPPVTPDIWHKAYTFFENHLKGCKDNPQDMWSLTKLCDVFWESGKAHQCDYVLYETLRAFYKEGRLRIVKSEEEGAFPEYCTVQFRVYIE